jgi:hypothetical protein
MMSMCNVSGVGNAGQVTGVQGAPSDACAEREAIDLMPNPVADLAASGDAHARLAALMLEMNQERKAGARELKRASYAAADQAARERIDLLRDKADKELAATCVEAGGQLAGAGLVIGGVARGAGETTLKGLEAGDKALSASGKAGGAVLKHWGSRDDSAAEQAALRRDTANRAAEEFESIEKDADEALRRAVEHYKELSQAKQDAQRAAIHRA